MKNNKKTLYLFIAAIVLLRVGGVLAKYIFRETSGTLSGAEQLIILLALAAFWGLIFWYLRNRKSE